jgi:Rieske 2Fe-2S family protein
MDGKTCGTLFPHVTAEDLKLGYVYMTGLPSIFMMAHSDHVRVVRVRPLGAEQTELRAEFLFLPEALADPAFDPGNVVQFADLVMSEDADVCERNQRGLHAVPHMRGVLMPEEYVVHQFQQWVQSELTRS